MPTYDYQCDSCGHVFEAFQSMSEDPLKSCPECKEEALRRLISGGSGVIFKGSGFYVTDSRKGSSSSSSSKSSKSSGDSSSGSGESSGGGSSEKGSKKGGSGGATDAA